MGRRVLRAMSWNIHGGVGGDGREDLERIAEVIAQAEVDFAGLQEVNCCRAYEGARDPLEWLGQRLGMHAIPGPARPLGAGYFGNALLSRVPVQEARTLTVSYGSREPRALLDARLALNGEGDALRVVVAHFGLTAAERYFQTDRLLEVLQEPFRMPVVVLGDFNEWRPRASTTARLDGAFGRPASLPRTFPARWPLLRLDRIWARPLGMLQEVQRIEERARLASDHLPLLATLTLPSSVD